MSNSKLFVRNLSFNTSDSDLSGLFAEHGNVVSAKMATDRDTGRPRGFAFIEMGSEEAAQDAIRALDQREFNGRVMHVAMSEPRRSGTAYGSKY